MDVAALKKEAKNKKTSLSRLEELSRISNCSVQLAVANNPSSNAETLKYLGGHNKWTILKAVAKHANTPDLILKHLARHTQVSVREALIEHPKLPPRALETLAKDSSLRLYYFVFKQATALVAAPLAIETLISSVDEAARKGAAEFLPLNQDQFKRLSCDVRPEVQARLFKNSYLRQNQKQLILDSPNEAVRAAVIRQWQFNPQQLELLLSDPSALVRSAVAHQHQLELNMLESLSVDPAPEVRAAVASRFLSFPEFDRFIFLNDSHPRVRAALATRTDETSFLETLALDPDERVRICVACSHRSPLEVIKKLITDPSTTRFAMPEFDGGIPAFTPEPLLVYLTIAERATIMMRQKIHPRISESFSEPIFNILFE